MTARDTFGARLEEDPARAVMDDRVVAAELPQGIDYARVGDKRIHIDDETGEVTVIGEVIAAWTRGQWS